MMPIVLVSASWVFGIMQTRQPSVPYGHTYSETSTAIANAANENALSEHPLFPLEEEGARHTASILLGIGWYESRWNPTALSPDGKAFGLFQIKPATAKATANDLFLPATAAKICVNLIQTSMRVCGEFPWAEKLGWYARGGPQCTEQGRKESRPRLMLAEKFFRENPATIPDIPDPIM